MQHIINTILFGKYEIISILGTGTFGTVYLSKHKILECYRAIKQLPKTGKIDSLLHEAQLLKSFQHPGIPTIYDIEQDENFFYLIEEYVEGESLEEFLLQQSHISHSTFLDLSLQLCDIFHYLHTRKPSPVLYLDLKPEHIIVCGMQIKLIDFNTSTFLSNTGNIFNLYGNKDFSAPELFSGKPPNLLSDIYSMGKLMEYLSKFLDDPLNPRLHQIINTSISPEPAHRFETVDELISVLKKQKECIYQDISRKKIAVVGSHTGCGATHICISLVSALNYMGFLSIYYESNQENNLQKAQTLFPYFKEREGLLCYKYFKGFPNYGPGIILPNTEELFSIYDYGNSFPTDTKEFDLILFVCSNSFWHWQDALAMEGFFPKGKPEVKIICNLGQKISMRWFATSFSRFILRYPYDSNLFSINRAKINFVTRLLNVKRRKISFFDLKNLIFPKKS